MKETIRPHPALAVVVSTLLFFSLMACASQPPATPLTRNEPPSKISTLRAEQRYSDAITAAQQVLERQEKKLGPDHPEVARTLAQLGVLYQDAGDYDRAEPLLQRALAIREKALGSDHPDIAFTLDRLGSLYSARGDFPKAEMLYQRAIGIKEKTRIPVRLGIARTLTGLGQVYTRMGDYSRAEPILQRALAIREKALGTDHPDISYTLVSLGSLYAVKGDFSRAETVYKKAIAIQEKSLGPDHTAVSQSLTGLGQVYRNMGDYSRAEPLLQRALSIREKTLGPNHPTVAHSLHALSWIRLELGDYAKAETLMQRTLEIREKALGLDHLDIAGTLLQMGELHRTLGDYAKAEQAYQRAVHIQEKALGPEHPDVASSLAGLAVLYRSMRDLARAEPASRRALDIRQKALGPTHPSVAQSLNTLALIRIEQGNSVEAEPLYLSALAIRESVLGPEHPWLTMSLNNLAMLYVSRRDFVRAEPLLRRAIAIQEKTIGSDHPNLSLFLTNLGLLNASTGNYSKALETLDRSQKIDSRMIDTVMGFTSEEQKMKFLVTKHRNLFIYLNLVNQHLSSHPSARRDALGVWLRRKGVILESQKRFQDALLYSDAPEVADVFVELARVRTQMSRLMLSAAGDDTPESYPERLAALQRQKGNLESKLARLSQAFAAQQKTARADADTVADALPAGTALIEFARVDVFNFRTVSRSRKWLPAHYLVFVLHAGRGNRVEMVDLGDAAEIEALVFQLKQTITGRGKAGDPQPGFVAKRLYEKAFAPLKVVLGGVHELFISPDGNLNLIPFEVLQGPDGRYLIEDYTFNYLGSGKDVLSFGETSQKKGKALVMGDPDFDLGQAEKSSTLKHLALAQPATGDTLMRSTVMRSLHFSRLPGTRDEVRAISSLMGAERVDLFMQKEALEEVLRQKPHPVILHLATHGFFLSDIDLDALSGDDERGVSIQTAPEAKTPSSRKVTLENPLTRSGIALAGANRVLDSGDLSAGDGIMTAEKILGLKLRGTDMVVLSACETGLGEVKSGEGVFGLRRAFAQAGAKSLVMSMWPVPDRETKELMVAFYKNLMLEKMNRCQALREAILAQQQVVRQRYGDSNPFYWGAFVFMGEP